MYIPNNFIEQHRNEVNRLQQEYKRNMDSLNNQFQQYQSQMNNPNMWQQQPMPQQQPVQQAPVQQNQAPVNNQQQQEQAIPIPIQQLAAIGDLKGLLEKINNTMDEIKNSMKNTNENKQEPIITESTEQKTKKNESVKG